MAPRRRGSARRYASGVDLVIRGGTLIDGTADAQPRLADIGIGGGRIVAVGDLSATEAAETIDATGLVVAPGFIDPHTHVETAILEEREDALAPVLQGVTTVMTAPDGFGWAPLEASAARELWAGTAGIPRTGAAGPRGYGRAALDRGVPGGVRGRSRRSMCCPRSPVRPCVSRHSAGRVAPPRIVSWT